MSIEVLGEARSAQAQKRLWHYTTHSPALRVCIDVNMNQDRCHNWMAYYGDLKMKVSQTRKSGMITSGAQKLGYEEEIKHLQRTLRTIQESPMEYEMCVLQRYLSLCNRVFHNSLQLPSDVCVPHH